ncbi:hypothetical protein K438DRAFT_2009160 [Mycena galopus ATCC 62051]|nr:hypothetical protein K438DRAFT_2009160 [Mycena galopus ATCC 62051]
MSGHLRRRLADLDTKILEQRHVLHQLHQSRLDVERELHATATYPVLTLPTEITAEIFLCCLPVFDPLCIPNHKSSAPIVLTAVCRQWRDIALATPVLWSKLQVRFDKIAPEIVLKPALVEEIIDRWLTRAGSRPLSLEFERKLEEPLFTLSRDDLRPLDLNSAIFPLLQVAALGCNDDDDEDDPIILFTTAPRFHDLHFLCEFTLETATFALPWQQLTKFTGTMLWDLKLFSLAGNLTELTCAFVLDHIPPAGIITHHNLRSLTITEDSEDIIQYLTLPALRDLDVSDTEICNDALQSFLVRSSPPLVSLSVRRDHPVSYFDHLGQWLRLLASTLEILKFVDGFGDDLSLIFPLLSNETVPRLRIISFKDLDGPLNFSDLVYFLYSRSDKLDTFKFVSTSSPFLDATLSAGPSATDICEDTISGHLSHLTQKGMDIYLGTVNKNYAVIGDVAIEQNLV